MIVELLELVCVKFVSETVAFRVERLASADGSGLIFVTVVVAANLSVVGPTENGALKLPVLVCVKFVSGTVAFRVKRLASAAGLGLIFVTVVVAVTADFSVLGVTENRVSKLSELVCVTFTWWEVWVGVLLRQFFVDRSKGVSAVLGGGKGVVLKKRGSKDCWKYI